MMRLSLLFSFAAITAACSSEPQVDDSPRIEIDSPNAAVETAELGPVSAVVSISPKQLEIGDDLFLEIKVTAPQGYTLALSNDYYRLLPFETLHFVPKELIKDSEQVLRHRYSLRSALPGPFRVPALLVEVTTPQGEKKELFTKEVAGAITMPDVPPGDIEISRTSLDTKQWRISWTALWVGTGIGILVVAVVLIVVIRRRVVQAPQIDPFALAISRIKQLEAKGLPTQETADEWYVELSAIIRQFIEMRFGLRAPELTTEEFLQEARSSSVLSAEDQESLTPFLSLCDRVKFAGHDPGERESNQALSFARSFVEQSRPLDEARGDSESRPDDTAKEAA